MPIVLTRNAKRYVHLAQAIIDAVPCSWNRISAHLILSPFHAERCAVQATCGDQAPGGVDCRMAVRKALSEIGTGALVPRDVTWAGIWVDYDIEGDRLAVTIMHGGRRPRPAETVLDYVHDDDLPNMAIRS